MSSKTSPQLEEKWKCPISECFPSPASFPGEEKQEKYLALVPIESSHFELGFVGPINSGALLMGARYIYLESISFEPAPRTPVGQLSLFFLCNFKPLGTLELKTIKTIAEVRTSSKAICHFKSEMPNWFVSGLKEYEASSSFTQAWYLSEVLHHRIFVQKFYVQLKCVICTFCSIKIKERKCIKLFEDFF